MSEIGDLIYANYTMGQRSATLYASHVPTQFSVGVIVARKFLKRVWSDGSTTTDPISFVLSPTQAGWFYDEGNHPANSVVITWSTQQC